MQLRHREHLAADKAKKDQPDYNDELLKKIDEAVKPDNRDNQGDSDGRDTEN